MHVEPVPCLTDNYAYVVASNGYAVVVDPSEAAPVEAAVERLGVRLVGIWLTHHHHDHVGGVAELVAAHPSLVVVASAYDQDQGRIPHVSHGVRAGEPLWFGSRRARVIEVPGHTLGAVAYLIEGALFCGDTLFCGGCGRLFEGSPAQMQQSLALLRELPADTLVYPGHEYTVKNLAFGAHVEPRNADIAELSAVARTLRAQEKPTVPTTLGQELRINPFLRWDDPAVIAHARTLGAGVDEVTVFAAVRREKDSF